MNRVPSPDQAASRSDEARQEAHQEAHAEVRVDARPEDFFLDDGRERMRKGQSNVDPFDITDIVNKYARTRGDPTKGNILNEVDFNWKRYEVAGKQDYSEQRAYYDQGWRPVIHTAFPGRFAPPGTTGPVIVKDMILMTRPMRLTVQARNEEIAQANRAMEVHRRQMAETPEGQAPRMAPIVRSSREAIEIPEN